MSFRTVSGRRPSSFATSLSVRSCRDCMRAFFGLKRTRCLSPLRVRCCPPEPTATRLALVFIRRQLFAHQGFSPATSPSLWPAAHAAEIRYWHCPLRHAARWPASSRIPWTGVMNRAWPDRTCPLQLLSPQPQDCRPHRAVGLSAVLSRSWDVERPGCRPWHLSAP